MELPNVLLRNRCLPLRTVRKLCFPSAENTHRYQDAHAEVYKLIIDGLRKDALKALGDSSGIVVKPGDKRTLDALEILLPDPSVRNTVRGPADLVSEQRRLATHKDRPQAQPYAAFEQFGKDIRAVILGLESLRDDLAKRLNVDVARCEERASAMRFIPTLDPSRPTQPNYSVFKALRIEGKKVEKVRTGERVTEAGVPETEALVTEFSDGSLMSIEATCNIAQLILEDATVKPNDLHITLSVTYVPPMLPHN